MDTMKISEFLKSLRKEKGYTQQDVADRLYVTQKSVSRWETGEGIPDINIISSVADFYGVTVDEILRGERRIEQRENQPNEDKISLVNKIKLITNSLKSKLNVYFITSVAIFFFFIVLGLILGLLVNELVGVILIPVGYIIGLLIYLYGVSELNKMINEEDSELIDGLNKTKQIIRQKNIMFSDIFIGCIVAFFMILLLFAHL